MNFPLHVNHLVLQKKKKKLILLKDKMFIIFLINMGQPVTSTKFFETYKNTLIKYNILRNI